MGVNFIDKYTSPHKSVFYGQSEFGREEDWMAWPEYFWDQFGCVEYPKVTNKNTFLIECIVDLVICVIVVHFSYLSMKNLHILLGTTHTINML